MMYQTAAQTGIYERFSFLGRGVAVWFVIAAAESVHGTLRRLLLEPMIGDLRARQSSVFTGSLLIFVIAFVFVRWLKGSGWASFLVVGGLWVVLTVAFEAGLGRLVLGLSWDRILSDYDLARGGLMPVGLLIMFLSPAAAAWLTDEV